MRYFLFLLLLLPLRGLCQHATIAATKMNMLYIGVPNPISFAVEGMKCSELTMVVEKGTATKTGDCEYDVTVTKPGRTAIFIVRGKDTVYRTEYRVKYIPTPVTDRPDDSRPGVFYLDSIRAQTELVAISPENFAFDAEFSVVSFEITVLRYNPIPGSGKMLCSDCFKKIQEGHYETLLQEKNDGGRFNNLIKDFIQNKLKAGDRVYIDEIKAKGPDGRVRRLNPLAFQVQ